MADKVQLIKEEIEILKHTDIAYDRSRFMLLLQIEDFINSLPEEHNEDLEKEIKLWIPAHIEGGDEYLREVAIEWSEIVARHFAEWQEQQMMKDAVETSIVNDWQYGKDPDHAIIPAIHQRIEELFNVGDKVKIIILKTE